MRAFRSPGRAGRLLLAPLLFSTAIAGCNKDNGDGPSTEDLTCSAIDPLPRRIWRLSTQQFSNSVRDLLGLDTAPDLGTLGGQSTYAFFADATLTVDPQLSYNINSVLRQTLATVSMPALAACQSGEADAACAQRFAGTFGLRAFRRPLAADEVTRLMTVYGMGALESFDTGISLMIQALLQSPSFLFRSELGAANAAPDKAGNVAMDPYEVATQLSYTFLNSTPDQPLLDAAGKGGLNSAAGVGQQIDRLLQLPATHENIDRITLDWFNVRQLYAKQKDKSLLAPLSATDGNLGTLTTQLQNDLITSTQLFVDDLYWNGTGQVVDLLTADKLFVNQRLATLFGLPFSGGTPDDFVGVSAASQNRAGMLTQPGLLWAVSDVASTSIVHRGIGIHDNVVCADPIIFPTGLINSPDIVAALAARPTEIEKSDYRLHENAVCTGCHGNIDPYGRVLEGFDPVGNVRTVADGLPVDQVDNFDLAPPLSGDVDGPVDLAQKLIASKQFIGCAAQMISSYAIGRMIHKNATCEVQAVRRQFEKSDGKISSLFRGVATAAFIRARSAGGAQ